MDGNCYDYGFRIYNPKIAKFLSVDPLTQSYPWYTPYQFAGNKPIQCIDLDGLEEYDSYKDYKKSYGANPMSEDKWDGSDGAWLEADRSKKSDRWKNAMASITKNNLAEKLVDKSNMQSNPSDMPFGGSKTLQSKVGSSFGVVRDYYLWAQGQMDDKGFKSRWAIGAAYLVDELADTYEEGATTGGIVEKAGKLAVALNVAIKDYAVGKFQQAIYLNGIGGKNFMDGYNWNHSFIKQEQGPIAAAVYEKFNGTTALNVLNDLARKDGVFGYGAKLFSKNYIPSFALFDNLKIGAFNVNKATINTASNSFGVWIRINLPMLMLWPDTHTKKESLILPKKTDDAIWNANSGSMKFYEKNKIK